MANIKSNEKRARQSKKRYLRNRMWKERVKELKKEIIKHVTAGNVSLPELKELVLKFQSVVDKTYTKNVYKKNKVANLKVKLFNFLRKHNVDLTKIY